MPTMPERLAVVETEVRDIKSDVTEIKGDVKTLLNWMGEERGARKQRAHTVKLIGIGLTVLTVVINIVFKVV